MRTIKEEKMLDNAKRWEYDEEEAASVGAYEEDDDYTTRAGRYGNGNDDDDDEYDDYGDGDDYGDDLGNYGSDVNGVVDEDADMGERERVERIMDSAFLLNETDGFAGRPDADKIRNNFRQYVRDAKSGNVVLVQRAQEGACKDLEFFIISLINRSFSTYVEKDREFFEDLVQAGRLGIMLTLAKYDPEISMPTTYFFNPIKHEMVMQVNQMKHGTKSHMATAKKKIQEVDRMFAKYGRVPTLHDYVYMTKCPFHRIENALAELKAGNVKASLDDPEAGPLPDTTSYTQGPDEQAMGNVNAARIIRILYKIEPRKEIVECFLESIMGDKVKTSELAQRYGIPQSEIAEGIRNLGNLARYNPEIRKMYPERFRVKENELSDEIAYLPIEEGKMALESVLESLQFGPSFGEPSDLSFA